MIDNEMKVKINGHSFNHTFPETTPFVEVMQSVNSTAVGPGLVIRRVALNGKDITGADWSAYMGLNAGQIQDLEIETTEAKLLARETLVSLREFIIDLASELSKVAEYFRRGEDVQALEIYGQAIDGIQIVNFTTHKILKNLEVDIFSSPANGRSIYERLTKLDSDISEMLKVQQEEDWILLADLIDYELIPHLEDRQIILQECREIVDE